MSYDVYWKNSYHLVVIHKPLTDKLFLVRVHWGRMQSHSSIRSAKINKGRSVEQEQQPNNSYNNNTTYKNNNSDDFHSRWYKTDQVVKLKKKHVSSYAFWLLSLFLTQTKPSIAWFTQGLQAFLSGWYRKCFHTLATGCMFSRARLAQVVCFPAQSIGVCLPSQGRGCMFSRARHRLNVFPRWVQVICFPALGTGCMFSRH